MYDVERALKGVQKALLNQNIQNSKSSKQKLTRRLPNNICGEYKNYRSLRYTLNSMAIKMASDLKESKVVASIAKFVYWGLRNERTVTNS